MLRRTEGATKYFIVTSLDILDRNPVFAVAGAAFIPIERHPVGAVTPRTATLCDGAFLREVVPAAERVVKPESLQGMRDSVQFACRVGHLLCDVGGNVVDGVLRRYFPDVDVLTTGDLLPESEELIPGKEVAVSDGVDMSMPVAGMTCDFNHKAAAIDVGFPHLALAETAEAGCQVLYHGGKVWFIGNGESNESPPIAANLGGVVDAVENLPLDAKRARSRAYFAESITAVDRDGNDVLTVETDDVAESVRRWIG